MTVDTKMANIPLPIPVGPEQEALRPFHCDGSWEGVIHAGGMGPGTPGQRATGVAKHTWIQGGRWVVGTYQQDQFLEDGSFVLRWELHWVCGWSPSVAEYRATIADNYGNADVLRGRIDGDRMIFESLGEGPPIIRLTWDVSQAGVVLWQNELSLDGETWLPVEDYRITPSA
jgi:hypothetical protein